MTYALTRQQVYAARGWSDDKPAQPDHEEVTMPEDPTPATPCRECGSPIPHGRTAYCGDECQKVADRVRARERYRRRVAARAGELNETPTVPLEVDAGEPAEPRLNGHAILVDELLGLEHVGSVELEVGGHRLVVRPREAA